MEVLAERPTVAQLLEEKIRTRQAKVGIVGLGYVGLPLAVEFAKVLGDHPKPAIHNHLKTGQR
jgi:orotate phosphoribosyltransferase